MTDPSKGPGDAWPGNPTGWSCPNGVPLPQIGADPATPEYGLLQLPILDTATVLAMLANPNLTVRVVHRLVRVAVSQPRERRREQHPAEPVPARALLRCPLLTAVQIGELLDVLDADDEVISLVAAHPACDRTAAARLVRCVSDSMRVSLPALLDARHPAVVRLAAAAVLIDHSLFRDEQICAAIRSGRDVPDGGVDVLCRLAADGWRGSWQETVASAAGAVA